MDPIITLQEAGLTRNEAIVYLAVLDLGTALAGEITKRSGVNRTNVYDALERLIEKGLVSFTIGANRKHFQAANPERLVHYLEEEEGKLKSKREHISSIIPVLEDRRSLGKEPMEATVYKGRPGLKSVAEDVLKTRAPLFAYGAEGNFVKLFTHFAERWHKQRGEYHISLQIIWSERVRVTKSKTQYPLMTARFSTLLEAMATTWIYGDKIAIIVWSDQPVVTVIRNQTVAKSYKEFFGLLWANAKA